MSIHSLDGLSAVRNGPTIRRRLRWLDDRLRWHGFFRRSDLVARFGISPQQASGDIATLNEVAPGRARFDPASKEYVRGNAYKPLFPKDPVRWMDQAAEAGDEAVIRVERLSFPSQMVDDDIIAAIIRAYEARKSLMIRYQSMSSKDPTERTICPHHVVDTGDRLHVRAWDDRRRLFADFVLARILSAEARPDYPWVDGVADTLWHERVKVVLAPHEGLSASQKAVVEREYGMVRGRVEASARKALVTYFLERLGLLAAVQGGDGAPSTVKGIRCVNAAEIRPLLPPA